MTLEILFSIFRRLSAETCLLLSSTVGRRLLSCSSRGKSCCRTSSFPATSGGKQLARKWNKDAAQRAAASIHRFVSGLVRFCCKYPVLCLRIMTRHSHLIICNKLFYSSACARVLYEQNTEQTLHPKYSFNGGQRAGTGTQVWVNWVYGFWCQTRGQITRLDWHVDWESFWFSVTEPVWNSRFAAFFKCTVMRSIKFRRASELPLSWD